jgi:integrase
MQKKETAARRTQRRRGKGDGTLILRGGTWQARWQVNGKVYVRSTGTGSKREAERRLAQFTADFRSRNEKHIVECLAARVRGIDAEIDRLADERAALPIMAAWTAYTRLQSRPDTGPQTMGMYESQYFRLVEWLKANHPEVKTIQEVTRPIAEAFAEHIAQNFSAGTFNKYRVLLRCVWNALAESARLKTNPWEAIRRKRQTPHVRRALAADELKRVLAAAAGEMRVLFAVGAYTGLRLGDCATLRWESVDMATRTLTVTPRKTARRGLAAPVTIPLHPSLFTVLDETPKGDRRGAVMPRTAELYERDTATLAQRTRRVFESCGIETRSREGGGRAKVVVGFHSLRHTFVSMSANAGAPLAVVQSLVGHSTPAMTMHYYHGTTDAARAAVNALPALVGADGEAEAHGAADAPTGRVAALCAIARQMTDAELAEAAERLAAMRTRRTD